MRYLVVSDIHGSIDSAERIAIAGYDVDTKGIDSAERVAMAELASNELRDEMGYASAEKIAAMKNADNQADRDKAEAMEKWIHENGYSETGFQKWYIEKYGKDDYENTFGSSSGGDEEEVEIVELPAGWADDKKLPDGAKDAINAYFDDAKGSVAPGAFVAKLADMSQAKGWDMNTVSKILGAVLEDAEATLYYLTMLEPVDMLNPEMGVQIVGKTSQ